MGVHKDLIPVKIIEFLEHAEFLCVATVDEVGNPCVANKFLIKCEDHILYIGDFVRGKTWQNIQANAKVSLAIMDTENLIDYQINGTASILEKGREYDRLHKDFFKKDIRFSTNRVLEGIHRQKEYRNFTLPLLRHVSIIKMVVTEVIQLGPGAEVKKAPFAR